MSIQDIPLKIKHFLADDAVFTAGLLLLVGVASFGLGRQSVLEVRTENHIPANNQSATAAVSPSVGTEPDIPPESLDEMNTPVQYVASKNSDKYHLPWCSGAARISETNKIYFSSKAEAEAAGYQPASNCKGI